jgi:hypothetical protein
MLGQVRLTYTVHHILFWPPGSIRFGINLHMICFAVLTGQWSKCTHTHYPLAASRLYVNSSIVPDFHLRSAFSSLSTPNLQSVRSDLKHGGRRILALLPMLPESSNLPIVFMFAECISSGTRRTSFFAECRAKNTR